MTLQYWYMFSRDGPQVHGIEESFGGGLMPSKEDLEITQQLKSAGQILGIRPLDHKRCYSFLEKREL